MRAAAAVVSETVCMWGTASLARRLGVSSWVLRRELPAMQAAGLARFARVGLYWLVAEAQVALVRDWLTRRGLLPAAETA